MQKMEKKQKSREDRKQREMAISRGTGELITKIETEWKTGKIETNREKQRKQRETVENE